MDKIEKLLRKIDKKEREQLITAIEGFVKGEKKNLKIKKIKNSDFYRLRKGRFRIIFHYYKREIIIDSIKMRKEDTYKKM